MRIKIISFSFILLLFCFAQGCAKVNLLHSMKPDEYRTARQDIPLETKQKSLFRDKLSELVKVFNKSLGSFSFLSEKSKQLSSLLSDRWSGITKGFFGLKEKKKELTVVYVKNISKKINAATNAVDEVNEAAEEIFLDKKQKLDQSDINDLEKVLMAGKRIKLHFMKQAEQLKITDKSGSIYVTNQIEKFDHSLRLMNDYADRFGMEWRSYQ